MERTQKYGKHSQRFILLCVIYKMRAILASGSLSDSEFILLKEYRFFLSISKIKLIINLSWRQQRTFAMSLILILTTVNLIDWVKTIDEQKSV